VIVLLPPRWASDAAKAAISVLAPLSREAFDIAAATIGPASSEVLDAASAIAQGIAELPALPDAAIAKSLAARDPDVLLDLAGLDAAVAPLLAQRPAREVWTVGSAHANVPPLVDRVFAEGNEMAAALRALHAAHDDRGDSLLDAAGVAALWEEALRAHQQGNRVTARAAYSRVLDLQPGFAPAHYLRGVVEREDGNAAGARTEFAAALAAAPAYVDARLAAIRASLDAHDLRAAVALCEEGLSRDPAHVALWRTLGHAQLMFRDGNAAAAAFERALALDPNDGETHYNHGVALQMRRALPDAARAYQRALAVDPGMIAADFNLGVLFQERGETSAAIAAYKAVLQANPRYASAYKNLGEVLLAAGKIEAWLANFECFEANCPDALPLAVQALEACQFLGDYARLERYLAGLRREAFQADDEIQLADCIEELLYLLLYFDIEPEMIFKFAQTYDATARRVYGERLPRPAARRPGRLRIGYLSGDLRNHVMGKMMWQAIEHHDRERFQLFFYSLSNASDDWTERFRGIADGFESVATLTERGAALRIAEDDLDILVDLSTHTKGAKPGILAFKPARVQITHVASSGPVGLSAVDFKLTDRYADVPENQAFQQETLLAMEGCVYPYRHVAPATEHPFRREALGIPAGTVVIGAFANALKLSQRCLMLWRQVLERIPRARLAFSPVSAAARAPYLRLAAAAGIAADRLLFLPQGRSDAENQARYELVDFVLDSMPYGGVNGTLEALDMGVPVVTLAGRRHGERTSYTILANLGVTETVAQSGPDYVALAVRLADDAGFMARIRAAIRERIANSPLTDMAAHTRNLESAYLAALRERCPEVLPAIPSGDG
jgi:predicted O-linked N-acetylglucosamine transferase (SPINDLY family)